MSTNRGMAGGPADVLGHPLFDDVPDTAAALLLADAASLHAEPGQYLFHEGDPAVEYLYVRRGEIEVLRRAQDGQERMFHIFGKGQILAETAMFMTHGRYPMNARARGDAVVLCLKGGGLQAACRVWPELAMRLLERLSNRIYQRVNEVEWYTDSTAAQRVAVYLLRLPRDAQQCVRLPLTQRQLAAHLGVRAETLSRLLADWGARGYLVGARRAWVLQDLAFLEDLARGAQRKF